MFSVVCVCLSVCPFTGPWLSSKQGPGAVSLYKVTPDMFKPIQYEAWSGDKHATEMPSCTTFVDLVDQGQSNDVEIG